MIVNAGLAHLSDELFAAAIAGYVVALVAFCAEYAFGRRDAAGGAADRRTADRVLVGAGVAVGSQPAPVSEPGGAGGPVDPNGPADPAGRTGLGRFAGSGRLGAWCGRVAVGCVGAGAVVHAGSVVARGLSAHRLPWGNMYEFTSAMGLVAVAGFLLLVARVPQARRLGLFVLFPIVVLMFLAGTVLYTQAGPLVPALHSYWLAIHVTAAIVATGVFMISCVASVLFLVRQRYDRLIAAGRTPRRFPTALGWRLPPAATLDTLAYRTIAFGFPIWTFGIICGAIWAEAAWGRYWGWDPKETWAFIAWVIYAGYLHARATAGWKGSRAATINLLGFAAMTFNFFVVNVVISGLHSYAGLN
ncbi:MAG TPA: c-type cytochrome biogenesis protein CcsB [Mycobacteriales bacterium]|nr:c-type cytochrome biogenesis protein CcsB [Mycobacteriales bacterium]